MLDANTQTRIAKSCSDAAFGYASAATAACANMTSQAFGMWAAALQAMAPPQPEPRSWYRHPDERAAAAAPINPFGVAAAMMQSQPVASAWFGGWGIGAANAQPSIDAMMAPWTTWLAMWSGPRVTTAWPMAFALVASGTPRNVAVPAAEAHAAVLDATSAAAAQFGRIYSTYRSESGYAAAQVVTAPTRSLSSHGPAGASSKPAAAMLPMWPWLLH